MVEDVDKNLIEKMPENFKDSDVEAVYKGEKIVSILSKSFIANLIRKYHIKEENNETQKDEIKELNMKELAVFKIDNEEYAFDIKNVQEIIKYSETTPIPEAPMYVEGLFNLRGSIIPIISLQERLGFEKKLDDKTKIIVCNLKDEKVGFIVDDVSDIMFIDDKNISKTSNKEAIFDEVITLDDGKRVILNINLDTLIDDESIEEIKMIKEER
jgi:purine-binding chemotaxis protein CheW